MLRQNDDLRSARLAPREIGLVADIETPGYAARSDELAGSKDRAGARQDRALAPYEGIPFSRALKRNYVFLTHTLSD